MTKKKTSQSPMSSNSNQDHFLITKEELVKIVTDSFDNGVAFTKACLEEQHEGNFDDKFQNVTSKEWIDNYINKITDNSNG